MGTETLYFMKGSYKMKANLTSSLVAALMMGVFAGGAQAAASYCLPNGTNTDGMTLSDVKFEGANATDCYGILTGNDAQLFETGNVGDLNLLTWGTWTGRITSDDGVSATESYLGYDFTLSYTIVTDAGGSTPESGNWFVTIDPGPAAGETLYFDFAVALKGANDGLGYWYFDEAAVTETTSDGTYTFKLATNRNGGFQDLSHLSLYVRDGSTDDDTTDDDVVPEPGVLFLMGAGLLGLGIARRRKSA